MKDYFLLSDLAWAISLISEPKYIYVLLVKTKSENDKLHCKKSESYIPQESVWLAGGPTQTS
jgi:hypothetical protein